jgi:hypothetical protein
VYNHIIYDASSKLASLKMLIIKNNKLNMAVFEETLDRINSEYVVPYYRIKEASSKEDFEIYESFDVPYFEREEWKLNKGNGCNHEYSCKIIMKSSSLTPETTPIIVHCGALRVLREVERRIRTPNSALFQLLKKVQIGNLDEKIRHKTPRSIHISFLASVLKEENKVYDKPINSSRVNGYSPLMTQVLFTAIFAPEELDLLVGNAESVDDFQSVDFGDSVHEGIAALRDMVLVHAESMVTATHGEASRVPYSSLLTEVNSLTLIFSEEEYYEDLDRYLFNFTDRDF